MTTVAAKLQIDPPEFIQGNKLAEKLYREAFDSVFEFIRNSVDITDVNREDIGAAVNKHAQAIFMVQMGMKEASDTGVKTTGSELYKALGLGTKETQEPTEKLQAEFQKSAEKIEAYKAIVDGFDAELVGRFSNAHDKESSVALLQVVAKLFENTKTAEPGNPHSLLEMMERKEKIGAAIFTAVEEVSGLMKLNPKAYAGSLLSASLDLALKAKPNGITSITEKERISILETLKTKLNTEEKAEESHTKLQEFIQNNGKWLMMLFPMIAAPLAKIFSYVPILGRPLNALLGQVSSNAGTLLTVLASSALTSGSAKQTPPARASEPAKTTQGA